MFGNNLLGWLVLALGGAMAFGNIAALIRPPATKRDDTDLEKAPIVRSIAFALVGVVAAAWALASLVSQ